MTLCSTVFENMARSEAEALGLKDVPLVVVPHPIGGLPAARVRAKADAALDEIIANLVQPAAVPA